MGALTVEFARHRYRFAGLTPEQTDLGRSRFGVLLCRDDGTSDIQVDVHYVPSHSAAFTDGVRGFLFCGRSGAGKTTLCGLADELELDVLSDELNAVTPSNGSFELRAMPFAGDFGGAPRAHPPYPLTGLLGLGHSTAPLVHGCSKAEAVSRIVASCPYINADPLLIDELTTRVAQLVERIPLRILSFAKDTTFWSVLDHEYRSPHAILPR